ncbi:hypothetical protein [Altererythrobacter sp. GH1-8]|uniref:hypothetical protein n=1 Tax=Altererythrobacter sp. GH1-8 TaxID=3349333 RepID=UPI00374DB63E
MAKAFEPAIDLHVLKAPLRNVRAHLDGTFLSVDLIPSVVLDEPVQASDPSGTPELDKIISDLEKAARPIVEAKSVLRAEFESVQACVIQEEFVELFEKLIADFDAPPRILGQKGWFPFLRVLNSSWREELPDYQGGDWPELHHYKIVSMETHLDILGVLVATEWRKNLEKHP